MNRTLVAVFLVAWPCRAFADVQEFAHYSLKGVHDTAAPKVLRDHTGKSPDLGRQGAPKVSSNAPERRQKEYGSSLKFDEPGQCFSVAKNLVKGDDFMVEAWVHALKDDDRGWHAVVANGDGANGFLIAQHDDQWAVLVGSVGAATLGDVEAERWTHLAVVKSQGTVTGWLNGRQVCALPKLGGGAENFSIGATSPGREGFRGCVAEVRCVTFRAGKFDPACDFLGNPTPPRRAVVPAGPEPPAAAHTIQTRYATFGFDNNGFLVSITSRETGNQYCPGRQPSPLMSLHESGQPNDKLFAPVTARFDLDKRVIQLKYANGATAVIKAEAKDTYLRLQLDSLAPRGKVDNVVWGPLHTKIAGRIGDLIGVVRDDDWAVGMYGLDDNTIAGPVTDGDCYSMGYYTHSPSPERPLPRKYKEGQWFNIGGNGVDDTAYFSHPEEYFHYVCGNGAKPEPGFGSSVAYHSRDRRRSYVHYWSLLPGFKEFRARHTVSDPVPGVDFIGSGVAVYACPDDRGLATIEKITRTEGLPYVTDRDGKWIRDPAAWRPTVYWNGPVDKAIEYTKALGLKDISRDTGSFFASPGKKWGGRVGFKSGKTLSYKEFADLAHAEGLTHGGLHTLCAFLQGGISRDVTPIPSDRLQAVCRTKLAKDISETDTEIVVTDPSFLSEKGTWHLGDGSNYLRIGGEMLRYDGISDRAPWTLKGVKRGHASKATPHKAGDELVKLMQNCYNGFVPDMTLLLDYADYYADLMHRNGMDTINFDGFESTVYQNHGYYGTRVFCRRLFERYHKLTGGKWPRVTGSNVFPGAWEYLNVCDVGSGGHMFNAITGRRGIEGKDIGNGWGNSYYPGTFGIQSWDSNWSLYDAENLEAKAVGWDATYAFSVSQEAIDRTGERDEIFKAFRAWQNARGRTAFTKVQKLRLRDSNYKFHLEQTGPKTFVLRPIKEFRLTDTADKDAKSVTLANPHESQPLRFALRVGSPVSGCTITLPGGRTIRADRKLDAGQYVICNGREAYLADKYRKKLTNLSLPDRAELPQDESQLGVQFPLEGAAKVRFNLTVWAVGKGETVGK